MVVSMMVVERCSLWIQGRRDVWWSAIGCRRRTLAVRCCGLAGGWGVINVLPDDKVDSDLIRTSKLQ